MISVILPVYNAEKYVREAIESILNQTYDDFELIIINDGSKDKSGNIIASFSDSRIRNIPNDKNMGLIYTLNKGLSLAQGKYIARMDADDIAYPNRLEMQMDYMEGHPDCIVCGTDVMPYKNNHDLWFLSTIYKYDDKSIKKQLVMTSCFAHPTVMIRSEVLRKTGICYNDSYKYAEDYKFWIDLEPYGQFHNIKKRLLHYRITQTQVTHNKSNQTIAQRTKRKCQKEYLERLYPKDKEIVQLLFEEELSCRTIKRIKNKICDREIKNYLIRNVYSSLSKYTLKDFLYYILSFDYLKFDVLTNRFIICQFFKRIKYGE